MRKVAILILACASMLAINAYAETGISRSAFTTAIENKEPVSELNKITTDTSRVYFFTEFMGLKGHTITHRWHYNGQVLAEISFQISADRWRTWSSKNMLASWTGEWQVSVLDEGGNIIDQSKFEYISPQPELQAELKPESQPEPQAQAKIQTEEPIEAQ